MEYIRLNDGIKGGIPGLRLANIEGGSKPVAWFYRMFAKDYKVYMFDRKDNIKDPVTIRKKSFRTIKRSQGGIRVENYGNKRNRKTRCDIQNERNILRAI